MVRIERRGSVDGAAAASRASAGGKKSRASKASKTGRTSFARSLAGAVGGEGVGGVEEAVGAGGLAAAGELAIEATDELGLLAIQEQDDRGDGGRARQRAIEYGEGLLERLDALHARLLAGEVSQERLEQLQEFFARDRAAVPDERLRSILAEIDLRVQVELAKRRR